MHYQKAIAASASFAILVAGAAFLFGFARVPAAHADTVDCTPSAADIAQITAIQNDPTLTPSQELSQELALRRQLVGETIACAEQEAQTFQTNLATTTVESDAQPLQAQLLSDLGSATEFYNLQLTKLSGAGIAGTEAIAQEVLAWRAGTFFPLSENVNNFILWAQNQDLFNTAQTRMADTQRAVSFLESASPNPNLQSAFDSAQSSFNDAESENAAVKAALAQGLSPEQTLALIKQSLSSLSGTYQGFFNVSTQISNILPQ
jgi:hypothetical protein